MKFLKIHGTENDFVFFDTSEITNEEVFVKQIPEICHRRVGVGADGVVVIAKMSNYYEWKYYNSDGSAAEFCGNAVRCAGAYIKETYGDQGEIKLKTDVGTIRIDSLDHSNFKAHLSFQAQILKKIEVQGHESYLCQAGVPHVVILTPTQGRGELLKVAQDVRSSGETYSTWNITFVKSGEPTQAVTFERGVEDFTQSCGSGAISAAYVVMSTKQSDKVIIKMPGGLIKVDKVEGGTLLEGLAEIAFSGHWRLT
ncbi:MAG: diaminopimelate epimerase [Bdellovibrionales bacterium CG10_big_fil_rev_8_21_14_0_10_45_34]|nr:MAG: diaminopimelate epimerase [Bdellovibrionales bacterium CG10_big_fil_rev_8_21_14_0_10_45_34]